jgi:hypothetical protein
MSLTDAFRELGALLRTVHHPAGDRSGQELVELRITEFAVHAWDLSHAIGADEQIDPLLAAEMWKRRSVTGTRLERGRVLRSADFGTGRCVATGATPPPRRSLSVARINERSHRSIVIRDARAARPGGRSSTGIRGHSNGAPSNLTWHHPRVCRRAAMVSLVT